MKIIGLDLPNGTYIVWYNPGMYGVEGFSDIPDLGWLIHKHNTDCNTYIEVKYRHDRFPVDEARKDAFGLGLSELEYSIFQQRFPPIEEYMDLSAMSFHSQIIDRWQRALDRAKPKGVRRKPTWRFVEEVIESYSRESFALAEVEEYVPYTDIPLNPKPLDRGYAFLNLYYSLVGRYNNF